MARAEALAAKALALDPELSEAVALDAYVRLLRRDFDGALRLAERAMSLGPSNADTHVMAAIVSNYAGLAAQGLSASHQARRLSPMAAANVVIESGHALWLSERWEAAIEEMTSLLAEHPRWRTARALLVAALQGGGRIEEARAEAAEISRAAPKFSLRRWALSHPYRREEDLARYIDALREAGLPE